MTPKEQRELHDAAWLTLTSHGVVADTSTYKLAMELADRLTVLRDRQQT